MDGTVVAAVNSPRACPLDGGIGGCRGAVGQMVTPGLAQTRQQRGGNNKETWLAPLVTAGTLLLSRGKFSDDKSDGREEGQMDSVIQVMQSGTWKTARKFLRYK